MTGKVPGGACQVGVVELFEIATDQRGFFEFLSRCRDLIGDFSKVLQYPASDC